MVQAGKVLLLEAIEPGVDGGEPRVLFLQLLGFVHYLLVLFPQLLGFVPQLFCTLLERVALHFHIYCWMPI